MSSGQSDSAPPTFVCPECGESDGLWEGVTVEGTAWRTVDATLTPDRPNGYEDFQMDWVIEDGSYGCSCGWEGKRAGLLPTPVMGIDGEPLPEIHPGQMDIGA